MNRIKNLLLLSLILVVSSCTDTGDSYLNIETPVVESYLFVGDNINHFKLSKAIPYTDDASGELETIDNADVKITVDGTVYFLSPLSEGNGSYSLIGEPFNVQANQQISFEFDLNGTTVSGTTTVPEKPTNFKISPSYIYLDKIEAGGFGGMGEEETIEITWDNQDSSSYYVKMQNMESNPDWVNEMMEDMEEADDFDLDALKTMVSKPEESDIYNVRSRMLMFFGTYRVVVYHINQEYVNMFEQLNNSSNNMTEPKTNIINGKGIFTGVATDTLYFNVYEN